MRDWRPTTSLTMLAASTTLVAVACFLWLKTDELWARLTSLAAIVFFGGGIPVSIFQLRRARQYRRWTETDDPRAVLVFATSRAESLVLMLAAAGMALGSYFMRFKEPDNSTLEICSWIGSVFFGALALLMAVFSIGRPPRLTLSPLGLDHTSFKVGPIPWDDILSVEAGQVMNTDIVSIALADQDKYFARGFPKRGRKLGRLSPALSSPFVISTEQLGVPVEMILDATRLRLAAFSKAGKTTP
jgi:hypothetical protein